MSGTATPLLRVTGSQLAQYFRFRCDRKLRWELEPGAEGVPRAEVRPGMGLLAAAGRRFERRKIAALVRRFGAGAVLTGGATDAGDARALPFEHVLRVLRDPGEVRFLVQPRLELPDAEAFAARHGIHLSLLAFAPAHPDMVRIGRTADGRVRLGVIDVKWSRERAVHHFAQVAFYVLLLEEIVRAHGIDAVVDTRWGWVWNRGARAPRRFALAAYRHHVERFLRDDLPRVARMEPLDAPWHLSPACAGCGFFAHCRAQADAADDLSRVPGMTPLAKSVLGTRGIRTVAELNKRGIRAGTYAGCHALESGEGVLKKRAMALSYRRMVEQEKHTHLLGEGERVRVVLSAESDPVSGTVFALGFRAERAGARPVADVAISPAGTHAGEGAMLRAFLARLGETATRMLAAGTAPEGRRGPKPLHAFVYDRAELDLLRGLLHRHMADADAQPGIAALGRLLFPGGGAQGAGLRAAAAAPGTVVVDAVSELFALPVPYAMDLAAVSAALQPREGGATWSPRADYGWPLSSQVAFERIHNVWRGRPHRVANERAEEVGAVIEQTVRGKLEAIDSVIRGVREQAAKTRTPRLRLDAGNAGTAVSADPIADPVLETLRIFTELEAAAESLAIRALHALPSRDRARRWEAITGMEPVERLDDREWVFEFDPECREAKFRPGEFALVLTNDNGEMLAESDAKPWLRRKLMVELVAYDLAHERPRVTLASDHGFARLEREGVLRFDRQCVLDRAEADFNTRRVVATLRRLAEGHGEARFVRSLLDGAVDPGWLLAPLDGDAGWRGTIAAAPRPVLNSEQVDAWRAAFERAITVIWGPPGTGKTYLLAWTLLGLAAAARARGRPLRILVSAATHRAIANVLVRIARELAASGIASPLRLVKLASRGTEADQELEGAGVELARDERLEAVLAESDATGLPVVVGSTVWSLWKQMKAAGDEEGEASDIPIAPMFDVVVIDEASQMKVADSLIALSSIRRGGRVLLCGDDRQLAPIVRGDYDDGNTLFGSAFAHFAGRFGRLALRESRRMNAPLVAYPRHAFYPGLVSVDPARRLSVAPAGGGDAMDAVIRDAFLRPDDSVVFATYTGYTATARNTFEARLAARIATLARAGLRDPASGQPYTADRFREQGLAILSPHRAQNSAILHELARAGWAYDELPIVDTVERMQGNEREMILVSYAVADHEYAEREADFLLDPNRFNVAITRPRAKLVVLMSDAVLRALPRDERVMTASMALKGYLRQPWRRIREIELPSPDGGTIPVTLRVR